MFEALLREGVAAQMFGTIEDLVADAAARDTVEIVFAPGHAAIGDDILRRLPRLAGLISPYMGIEGFDRAAATARGVLIGNGQMAESIESMAEGTVLMLLAAAYQLPSATAAMANGNWPSPLARGRLVRAMTVGIVGFGRIGQAVAARLAPFGCRLVVHAPRLHAALPDGIEAISLDALVASSDAILILASLGHDSRHMFDAALFSKVKSGAIIVNMARGGLIDEAALIQAASAGGLGWLALDVYEQEPLPADAAIRTLPNSILTPHCIGHTRDTLDALPRHAIESILRVLRGEPPLSLVNPDALAARQKHEWRQFI